MKDESSTPLVDYSLPPWCSMQKSGPMKPTANDLRAKVLHHASLDDTLFNLPCLMQWTVSQAKAWLHKYIITAEEDLAFIMRTIAECKAVAERAATEKAAQAKGLLSSAAVKQMGKYLIVCLIHFLVD